MLSGIIAIVSGVDPEKSNNFLLKPQSISILTLNYKYGFQVLMIPSRKNLKRQ
jgi:hypothetical protein